MWLSLRLELDLIIRMSRRTWTTHLPIFLINSVKVSNLPPGKTCAHIYPNLKRACMNCFCNCYHFDIWYLHRSGSSAPILNVLRKLVTFPNVGKVFYLSTHKLLVTRLSWLKGFPVTIHFLQDQVNWLCSSGMVWFGLKKALVSFRHDLGFSADAHRHQVSFGLSYISSRFGLWLCTLWALVHHHLSLGCEVRLLRHPALPLVHQLSLVRTFLYLYHMILYLYLLCRSCDEKNRPEI